MGAFFKKIGKGLLYIVVFPAYVVALCIAAIISLGGFIFLFFKSLVLFFTGRSLYEDLPEDKLAKQVLESRKPNVPVYSEPEKVTAEIVTPIVDAETTETIEEPVTQQENILENPQNTAEIAAEPQQIEEINDVPEQQVEEEIEQEETKIEISTSLPDNSPEIIEEYKSESHIFSSVDEEGGKDD